MSIKIPECYEFNQSMPKHKNSGRLTDKWNGPRTAEGRQRIAQAQLKHGAFSKAGMEAKHAEVIQLRQLEDIARLVGLVQGPRTRGAKPRGYKTITSMEAVKALVALE